MGLFCRRHFQLCSASAKKHQHRAQICLSTTMGLLILLEQAFVTIFIFISVSMGIGKWQSSPSASSPHSALATTFVRWAQTHTVESLFSFALDRCLKMRNSFFGLLKQVYIWITLFCPSALAATFSFCKKNISIGRRFAFVLLLS